MSREVKDGAEVWAPLAAVPGLPLGGKGFLRPDVRGRRYVDSNIDGTLVDYSVGFGWRF